MSVTKPRPWIMPQTYAQAQKLDNARAMLLVNGVLTSQQSREVRRKIYGQLTTKGER